MAIPFPHDIEQEILLRLPAKSLQRFTCVCKSWRSLITHPNFISTYHHRSSLTPQFLLLRQLHDPINGSASVQFSLTNESFLEKGPSIYPPYVSNHSALPRRIEFLNSEAINGIVCVVVYMGLNYGPETHCDLYLWNPFTGESVKTPVSEITGLFSGLPMVSFYGGFGYDDIGEDYKVLRVVYVDTTRVITEVYSLKENCWRGLVSQSGISSNTLWASSMCTFLRGVGHWGAYRREKERFFILGFDFREERFKKINLPLQCVDGSEMRYHCLWVYKGFLAISVLRFGEFESRVARHYIWAMMTPESGGTTGWFKLFNIDLEGGPRRPISVLKSGELLLSGEGDYVLYDTQHELCESIDIFDVDVVVPCVESLVSLNRLMPSSSLT